MKILQIHNKYQLSGGEDSVVENEKRLLESKGHEVFPYIKDNSEISNYSVFKKVALIQSSVWSNESYDEVIEIIKRIEPDICHVHNYMPLISPAVFYACKEVNIPVVQTLHNYRMLCTNAYLFRDGKVCEECIDKSLYHSLKYRCYRNSIIQTLTVARMIEQNKKKGTFNEEVDGYICLSNFARVKFIEGGLPKEKLFLKPNFLFEDPGYSDNEENYFFFAGRLDETKGVHILIKVIKQLPGIKFKVAGEGPYQKKMIDINNLEYKGHLIKDKLLQYLKNSVALIFPSVLYETFGLLIIEAFACGKPVIASRLGAMAELVEVGKTGLLFEPGSAKDLELKIKWAVENPEEIKQMGKNARREYEMKYTASKNYSVLMDIYTQVINNRVYE